MSRNNQLPASGEAESIVERTAVSPVLSFREFGLQHVVLSFSANFELIAQLTKREILTRYKGSLLGVVWSFVLPLVMLAIYTFVFSVVFEARWDIRGSSRYEFALILFAGLIVFQFFAECVGRATVLLRENVSLIKKVVFPLEALAWVAVLNAAFNAVIGFFLLFVAQLFVFGPQITILWLPLVLLPTFLTVVGLVWFLSSLGLFVRDTQQVVAVILPILMFASPVFYPVSALPEGFRSFIKINPLAITIEQVRQVMLFGVQPDFWALGILLFASILVAWAGLAWFLITRRGFADAI